MCRVFIFVIIIIIIITYLSIYMYIVWLHMHSLYTHTYCIPVQIIFFEAASMFLGSIFDWSPQMGYVEG